jgi:hypothetical protein
LRILKLQDSSLTLLAALPNLEHLNLYGTAVTDEGLAKTGSQPEPESGVFMANEDNAGRCEAAFESQA